MEGRKNEESHSVPGIPSVEFCEFFHSWILRVFYIGRAVTGAKVDHLTYIRLKTTTVDFYLELRLFLQTQIFGNGHFFIVFFLNQRS